MSIATPGFCQTTICGPVIDLLIDEAADRDDLHVVHAEVYVDPQRDFSGEGAGGLPETVPIVNAYGLPFEPALFVAAPDGTILSRLETIYDRSELAEAIAAL